MIAEKYVLKLKILITRPGVSLAYSLLHSMVDFVGNWTSNEQVLDPLPVFFLWNIIIINKVYASHISQVALQ